jgi:acyl dehydratase
MEPLYYDDLKVGMRFVSRELAVTPEDVADFAGKYDPQPFHLDPVAAEKTFFRGLVASGWHTSALTMRLVIESLPMAGGVVGGGVDELRWPNALRPGDVVHLESEVIEMRTLKSRADVGLVKFRVVTLNQRGEAVQSMVPNLFAPTRAGATPA